MLHPIQTITHSDGRIELASLSDISDSSAYNHDLAPVPVAKRQWAALHYSAFWAGMACNIPTYMIASGLIASGMNWWQAVLTVFTGNSIVLIPILLNSHAGTKYGIPFPILARGSYGILGSNLPALMRALVACGVPCTVSTGFTATGEGGIFALWLPPLLVAPLHGLVSCCLLCVRSSIIVGSSVWASQP